MTRVISPRNRLLAAVHAAAKVARLDDEARRDVIERVSGHRSAADCTDEQLGRVLDRINVIGNVDRRLHPRSGGHSLAGPAAARVRALWISLHALGEVRDPSEIALNAYVRRQAKVDDLRFLPSERASAVIDALKDWCRRAGVDWSYNADPRRCVVSAQQAILIKAAQVGGAEHQAAVEIEVADLCRAVTRQSSPAFCTAPELDALIREYGKRVREVKERA